MSFRETLWFKKGLLDAQAANDAQAAPDEAPTAADTLPIEDRYADDGSLGRADSLQFGLHTGSTRAIPLHHNAVKEPPESAGVDERVLVREMKRTWLFLAVGAGIVVVCSAVALLV